MELHAITWFSARAAATSAAIKFHGAMYFCVRAVEPKLWTKY